MSEATTYTPKKGDRVRVTIEGEAVGVGATSFRLLTNPGQLVSSSAHVRVNEPGVIIEKLQDPEPEWVNGDVIKVPSTFYGPRIVARINGEWRFTDIGDKAGPHLIGNHWPDIEILYKANAA